MKVSQRGIDLIKKFEGLRLEAYQCSADVWTIGYGTTRVHSGPVTEGMRITKDEAERLLLSDLRYFEQRVNDLVKVPLTQSQFDALVSLAYNVGDGALSSSTLLRELNEGNYQEAADQFTRWVHAGGEVLPGLVSRRNAERNLFSQADRDQPAAPPPPPPVEPAPIKEQIMAIPALVAAAGQALLPIVIDLFRARGSKTSDRNAKILEGAQEALPVLVDIAKTVAPAQNEQATAEAILSDKALQEKFRAAVALQWKDVEPFFQFEEESREKARGFAEKMTTGDGPEWRQIGFGLLIAIMSLTVIVGGGAMFWNLMSSPQLDPGQKGLILGALIASFTTVVGYFFGSSATSRQKDQIISDQAKK